LGVKTRQMRCKMGKDEIGDGLRRKILIVLILFLFFQPVQAQEQLVLLMPTPSKYLDPYIDRFEDWYLEQTGKPIRVEHVRKGGVECVRHVEEQAKQPYEDVVASIGYKEIERLRMEGYLEPYISPNARFIPETVLGALVGKDPEGYYTGFSLSAYGIMVNREVLKSEGLPMPTGYADLAFNPNYSGRIVMGSPILSRISHGNMEVMLSHFGWVQGWNASIHLASLVNEFTITTGKANDLVAKGEYAAVPTKYSYWYEYAEKGYPVEWVWPVEGTYIYVLYLGILSGARNEENAKLWVDWMLSEEGQQAWVECRYETVLRSDIGLPAGMPSVEELGVAKIEPNYDEEVIAARYDAVTELWLKLIGYHSILQKNYDNPRALDAYLNELVVKPMQVAANAMAAAQDTIANATAMLLTEKGRYFLERAEMLLAEAKSMYEKSCDYDEAYRLAREAENSAEVAMAYPVQPPQPPIWPYYLLIAIITLALLGGYLKRRQLERYSKKLEEEVAERTKELVQANLRLQELDRLKSMFIASMSHELRTPLNTIIGFTGIILQGMAGEITEEQRKQLTMVKNSANHLLALINDIIDLSKIEAGMVELAIEEFDLSALLKEVKESFKIAAAEKGLKLSFNVPEMLPIKSDRRRTKQVIVNLVSNAVKFTDRGEIEINVAKKDEIVEISVRDTGIGIRKEDMDKLFKAFSKIPVEDRPKQEGTGLGLYLSKKMADLLGGEIKAESEFGKGSVFTFTLPLSIGGEK
jgi:signal transduction histidine kinase